MANYWSRRFKTALESSRNAPNAEARDIYLRVAEHCRSLEQWCAAPRSGSQLQQMS